jgi:Cys-rich repeat protein
MHWLSVIGLTLGSLVALVPVALVAYINVGGINHALKHSTGKSSVKATAPSICAADTDCPSGHICIDGRCVAQTS